MSIGIYACACVTRFYENWLYFYFILLSKQVGSHCITSLVFTASNATPRKLFFSFNR